MLQSSKFVNTKANRRETGQVPIFSRSAPISKLRRVELSEYAAEQIDAPAESQPVSAQESGFAPEFSAPLEPETEAVAPAAPVPAAPAPAVRMLHPSVNLEEMQRQEDLQKQDEDWLSFFMGMTSASKVRMQEEVATQTASAVYNFGEPIIASAVEPIMTPPPAEAPSASANPFMLPTVPEINPVAPDPLALPAVIEPPAPEPQTQVTPSAQNEPAPPAVHGPCLDDIFSELISENKIFKRASAI